MVVLLFVPGYSLGRPHRAVIRSGNNGNASLSAPVAPGDNVNIWLTGSQRGPARVDGMMTDDVISTRRSSISYDARVRRITNKHNYYSFCCLPTVYPRYVIASSKLVT